ncbi:MAG: inositol monophosphatase [Bacilli bacterium]|nr:inositol monophosphatase [Bacilli bacterium]
MIYEEKYDLLKQCVLEAGKIILDADKEDLSIQDKDGICNVVTKYDVLVQDTLKKSLLEILPNARFMGEEEEFNKDSFPDGYLFVVDPIDGTTNFSCNLPMIAISVALLYRGKPVIGFCYNPYTNEFYEAQKGKGAYLNGKLIHVSNKILKDGLVLCGCAPYYQNLREKSLDIQRRLALVAGDYRRFGSAVLDICHVASGKAEFYFELKLMPWDFAAAGLILEEAGGLLRDIYGKEVSYLESTSITASNGAENYFSYFEDVI